MLQLNIALQHRKKKLFDIPVPSRDVTTKLSLGGNNDVIYKIGGVCSSCGTLFYRKRL
jgi:hypothetical protein